MVFERSTKFLKIAVVLLLLGLVLVIVAFSTNGWAQIRKTGDANEGYYDFGLWQACKCKCGNPENPPDTLPVFKDIGAFYKATQAMVTIGFLLFIAAFVLTLLSMIIYILQSKRIIKFIVTVLCFSCSLFMTIGIIVYGAKMSQKINAIKDTYNGNLYYSFGIAVVSTLLMLAAGVLSVIDMRVEPPVV